MQYEQRKLQRSVTEIRRSRIGRPSVSIGCMSQRYSSRHPASSRCSVPRCGARASPLLGARRRHRDLGLHVRPGAEGRRRLPAVRLPRRPLRDLDARARALRLAAAARACPAAAGRRRGRAPASSSALAYGAPDRGPRADDRLEHGLHHRALRRLHAAARARRSSGRRCRRRCGSASCFRWPGCCC